MPDYPLTSPARALAFCLGRGWQVSRTEVGFWVLQHGNEVPLILIARVGEHLADEALDQIRIELGMSVNDFIAGIVAE